MWHQKWMRQSVKRKKDLEQLNLKQFYTEACDLISWLTYKYLNMQQLNLYLVSLEAIALVNSKKHEELFKIIGKTCF